MTEQTETPRTGLGSPVQRYTVGKWHDLPNYQCTQCPFSTLDKAEMEEHWQKVHAPKPKPRRVVPQLVDRFGNPLTVVETDDG